MQAVKELTPHPLGNGQYLTFFVGGEEYAVNILKVKEIIEYDTVTAVPNTAPWIRGVTNLRGNVVPVIDLAVKFGLPASKVSKLSCIVITEVSYDGEKLTPSTRYSNFLRMK
jgi:purine-binding chemotaxis protein CheW